MAEQSDGAAAHARDREGLHEVGRRRLDRLGRDEADRPLVDDEDVERRYVEGQPTDGRRARAGVADAVAEQEVRRLAEQVRVVKGVHARRGFGGGRTALTIELR